MATQDEIAGEIAVSLMSLLRDDKEIRNTFLTSMGYAQEGEDKARLSALARTKDEFSFLLKDALYTFDVSVSVKVNKWGK